MLHIDLDRGEVEVESPDGRRTYALGSAEGFAAVSRAWLRAGWDAKYVYSFAWFGRPIIQLPDDMFRIQEVIYRVRPDVLVETGVAHGGSLVFYASLFKAMGAGRVIGVDIEIRPHNRAALSAHELFDEITLIEGSSTSPDILAQVRAAIAPGEKVLVMLDSNHSREHVLAELQGYAPLVTPDSYIVAADGIMKDLVGAPRSSSDWEWNNPQSAVADFLAANSDFVLEEPEWPFNEGAVRERVTYWPHAYLRRR